jgi:hypothetical protein
MPNQPASDIGIYTSTVSWPSSQDICPFIRESGSFCVLKRGDSKSFGIVVGPGYLGLTLACFMGYIYSITFHCFVGVIQYILKLQPILRIKAKSEALASSHSGMTGVCHQWQW